MTEFCEAVAYAIYCVGLEGLHTSLKPARRGSHIPLRWSYGQVVLASSSWKHHRLDITCMERTNVRHPDHTTIIEVDESLFWLQTSVPAFSTNAIES